MKVYAWSIASTWEVEGAQVSGKDEDEKQPEEIEVSTLDELWALVDKRSSERLGTVSTPFLVQEISAGEDGTTGEPFLILAWVAMTED